MVTHRGVINDTQFGFIDILPLLYHDTGIYVTWSDKTSLIARKYTHVYNGIYLLFCVCYSNSVSFIELLRIFASYMVKFVLKYCVQKKSY